jgi:hypothetical protein
MPLEVLDKLKTPTNLLETNPVAFRPVGQYFNQLHHRGPPNLLNNDQVL